METFKSRLNLLIHEKNICVSDISRDTGIARTTLQGYITADREPRRTNDNLKKLAEYFNVDEVWLLGFDVDRERITKEERQRRFQKNEELINKFWKLSKEDQVVIESLIDRFFEKNKK